MPSAIVVSAYHDGTTAYLTVRVTGEGSGGGSVEYSGSTPVRDESGSVKPTSQIREELIAACKAQRDSQRATRPALPISGTVTI